MFYRWFLIILIVLIAGLFVFQPSAGWRLNDLLVYGPKISDSGNNLLLENESLKTELAKLESVKSRLPASPSVYSPVFVYSRYPFNFKNEILINAGENQGIKINQAAVLLPPAAATPVLIGKVEKVFSETSLVETTFDGRFQLAVRIGSQGTDALLRGGASPSLALIPKDVKIAEGEAVYSTSPDFPYGLALGTVRKVRFSGDQLFQEADLETGYNPNIIQSILILKNH